MCGIVGTHDNLAADHMRVSAQYEQASLELLGLKEKHSATTTELETISNKYKLNETELKELKEQYNEVSLSHHSLTLKNQALQEEQESLSKLHATLTSQNQVLTSQHELISSQFEALSERHEGLSSRHEAMAIRHESITVSQEDLQAKYNKLNRQHDVTYNDLILLRQEDAKLSTNYQDLTSTHDALSKLNDTLAKQHEALTTEHQLVSSQHEALSRRHEDVTARHTDVLIQLEKVLTELTEAKNGHTEALAAISHKDRDIKQLTDEVQRTSEYDHISVENEQLRAETRKWCDTSREIAEDFVEKAKELDEVEANLTEQIQEHESLLEKHEHVQNEYKKMSENYHQVNNELKTLKSQDDEIRSKYRALTVFSEKTEAELMETLDKNSHLSRTQKDALEALAANTIVLRDATEEHENLVKAHAEVKEQLAKLTEVHVETAQNLEITTNNLKDTTVTLAEVRSLYDGLSSKHEKVVDDLSIVSKKSKIAHKDLKHTHSELAKTKELHREVQEQYDDLMRIQRSFNAVARSGSPRLTKSSSARRLNSKNSLRSGSPASPNPNWRSQRSSGSISERKSSQGGLGKSVNEKSHHNNSSRRGRGGDSVGPITPRTHTATTGGGGLTTPNVKKPSSAPSPKMSPAINSYISELRAQAISRRKARSKANERVINADLREDLTSYHHEQGPPLDEVATGAERSNVSLVSESKARSALAQDSTQDPEIVLEEIDNINDHEHDESSSTLSQLSQSGNSLNGNGITVNIKNIEPSSSFDDTQVGDLLTNDNQEKSL